MPSTADPSHPQPCTCNLVNQTVLSRRKTAGHVSASSGGCGGPGARGLPVATGRDGSGLLERTGKKIGPGLGLVFSVRPNIHQAALEQSFVTALQLIEFLQRGLRLCKAVQLAMNKIAAASVPDRARLPGPRQMVQLAEARRCPTQSGNPLPTIEARPPSDQRERPR